MVIIVFTFIIFALFWPIFSSKPGVQKLCEEFFEGIVFRGDFQVISGNAYPIHKLEMKRFSVVI
jgi:hypothetical protein